MVFNSTGLKESTLAQLQRMNTALSYKAFVTFSNKCVLDQDDPIINRETHLIPDDEMKTLKNMQVHQAEAPDGCSATSGGFEPASKRPSLL